jgi:hypothetical protein
MRSLILLACACLSACNTSDVALPGPISFHLDAGLTEFGGPCEASESCETGRCETDRQGVELPEGLCTRYCKFQTAVCEEGYCVGHGDGTEEGVCYPSCEVGDPPCRPGWVCAYIIGVRLCVAEKQI